MSITTLHERIDQAKARLEEEEAKFLCPRFDGEKYVETACLTCRDIGWIHRMKGSGEKWWTEVERCPDCGGGFDKVSSMLAHSGIPEAQRQQRFESFKLYPGTEEACKAVRALTADQQQIEARISMVLLYGGTGNGKTHLAHASGLEAISKDVPTKFIRCDALLRELKASKSQADEGQAKYDALFQTYSQVSYLIIDEFDWSTEADIKELERLVCEREANRLMTLVTSNRDINQIEDAMPRMISRFRDKRVALIVRNKGEDRRPKMAPDHRRAKG
jgi:DNA replication protein DnaC